MTQIIIFIVVILIGFFTRKIWSRYLVLLFSKKRNDAENAGAILRGSGSVFSPTGTKRTFIVAIEIDEQGDGTAKFAIVKLKEKEV